MGFAVAPTRHKVLINPRNGRESPWISGLPQGAPIPRREDGPNPDSPSCLLLVGRISEGREWV